MREQECDLTTLRGIGLQEMGFYYTLSLISGKYKALILYWLWQTSCMRFNELQREMQGISHKTLAATLKELEQDGLVVRTEYPQIPPKVEYRLSAKGESLMPVLDAVCVWGERWRVKEA
ncbi:HxlR family transcriptional regulator [Volucribacter psittacicida]|uniref:HxlR family transcriptional regulator n=1 Tax=Volucribacter psittacicida TaxID=203482 RepID=A0A4R1FYJ1_9PAST|nr:helix-turn-helix domain-containing protein [Volucribacter psittacicida]TCJ98904.1 HxlR family transcriptional regulator [Volucribacter psittacicida]